MFHAPQILHANDCVSRRFLLPALDQRVDAGKVARMKRIFMIFNFACEKFTKSIIRTLLPPTGSEKLKIKIYEQQNNVKLLSKKGIEKSCLQVNYKLRTLASLSLCHAGVFQICFETSVFDFEKMLNNKIDDDSNIKVCVKIYWKKTTVTLIILRKQLHGPLVIIVHKVSRCHGAMQNEFCGFENS